MLFYVLFVCKCVLPRGDNPISVNRYINWCHAVCFVFPCTEGYSWLGYDTVEPGRYIPAAQRICLLCCAVSNLEDSNITVHHRESRRYYEDSCLLGFYTGSCFGLFYPENEGPVIL